MGKRLGSVVPCLKHIACFHTDHERYRGHIDTLALSILLERREVHVQNLSGTVLSAVGAIAKAAPLEADTATDSAQRRLIWHVLLVMPLSNICVPFSPVVLRDLHAFDRRSAVCQRRICA